MKKVFIQLAIFMLISLPYAVQAANYDNPVEGIFRGVYGDTIAVEVPSTVSKSPDTDNAARGNISFEINSNTGYNNFHQLSDLKQGDPVKVAYINENPTNISKRQRMMVATRITKLDSVNTSVKTSESTSSTVTAPEAGRTVTTTTTTTEVNPE